ncbi:carboxymethylenebutenolidase [Nocardiopsis sp. Huas11]|uniref:dienelactone hydrolase family protein n=1 Tax=Nocardiopsis sp. Huas11 TaxID=2183912 RepID=UPI000F14D32E|nr:dienelactone hydrolase family protein [Nocardiopsis sp. Huas11]RKS07278.1 carboxymethylenebutenolidase [Nocardiopsis sp. Huas11]
MTDIDLSAYASDGGGSSHLSGYLARPDGEGPWPGVVVLHEVFGVDDEMRRHADHLAGLGYLALLPDLYSDGGPLRCVARTMRAVSTGHGRAFADIAAARSWLLARPECTGRIGVVGFCMGGGFAIAAAPEFDAAAPNYGLMPPDLAAAVRGTCPTVASYAARDRMLKGAATRLARALDAEGVPHDVKEYPAAGHSFMNTGPAGPRALRVLLRAMGTGPHPESAADAWRRIEAFFAEHLGTERGGDAHGEGAGSR